MKLAEHDKANPLWVRLREHYRERLEMLRSQNDSLGLTPEQTAHLRGQIAEVKRLLEMEKDDPRIE